MDLSFNAPNEGLVIRQPWLDMELSNQKVWEMRSQPTKKYGRIALLEQGKGLVVGEANLIGCIEFFDLDYLQQFDAQHRISERAILENWNVAWVLDDIRRYKTPIYYVHPQGAVTWVKKIAGRISGKQGQGDRVSDAAKGISWEFDGSDNCYVTSVGSFTVTARLIERDKLLVIATGKEWKQKRVEIHGSRLALERAADWVLGL